MYLRNIHIVLKRLTIFYFFKYIHLNNNIVFWFTIISTNCFPNISVSHCYFAPTFSKTFFILTYIHNLFNIYFFWFLFYLPLQLFYTYILTYCLYIHIEIHAYYTYTNNFVFLSLSLQLYSITVLS